MLRAAVTFLGQLFRILHMNSCGVRSLRAFSRADKAARREDVGTIKRWPTLPQLVESLRGRTMETLLIIVVVVLLLGGGGWYGRGRWY